MSRKESRKVSAINSEISSLRKRVDALRTSLAKREGERDSLVRTKVRLETVIEHMHNRVADLDLIKAYLTQFADERQDKVYRQIEATVSEGLRSVFEEDMRLEISTKLVGSRTELQLTLVSNTDEGELRTAIMDSRGGGVAAIVGFLIQAVLVLLTPGLRSVIFLDEPFRGVSSDFQAPLGEFISDLCERTGLQVVMVTHQTEIAETADVWYSFRNNNGKTLISKESGE